MVAIGLPDNNLHVIDRRRIELVEPGDASWAKQPYHAAEGLASDEARRLVELGVESAHRVAVREMRALVERSKKAGNQIISCGILIGTPMPACTKPRVFSFLPRWSALRLLVS